MALVKPPNAEMLASQFLRQVPELAPLVGDNVFTELPAGFASWPGVRVTRVGGSPAFATPLVVDRPLLQFDVWGGPKAVALDIAETIRAALSQRLPWTLAGKGTLGGVIRFGSLRYLPDELYDPARPRYTFDASIVTRP